MKQITARELDEIAAMQARPEYADSGAGLVMIDRTTLVRLTKTVSHLRAVIRHKRDLTSFSNHASPADPNHGVP